MGGGSPIAIAASNAMTRNAVPLNALQAEDLLGFVPRQLAAAGDGGATRRGRDDARLDAPRVPDAGVLRAARRGDARTRDRAQGVHYCGAHRGFGCGGQRARACGEHCRACPSENPKSPKAPLACSSRRRQIEQNLRNPNRSTQNAPQQSVWKYVKMAPLKKRLRAFWAAAMRTADQRAHTRVSTQEPLGSQETVRRRTARVDLLGITPSPSSVAAPSPRASPDPRALEPRRAEPYL